ncbi:hypothetical protein TNIN_199211 [Trichonephila inaurata madagascariensis]|uniref:Uncharacterized protein n=1 Tax=Trichonephila inaurata madagascariensis TaxID=2747483 RepID=A0A8X6XSD8_9ARAC|nr:hypothetical protein TNIN_199211 [Trichonephila inaurata madagascariensis]
MHFRIIVHGLIPPEFIVLRTHIKVLPDHEPLDVPCYTPFSCFQPADLCSDYLEQEAAKGNGAFIQALWTLHAKSKLYCLAYKAWKRNSPQNLTTWTQLAQAVLDGCYGEEWSDTVFQVSDSCPTCLSPMHWPEKTHIEVINFTCNVFCNSWM